MSTLSQGLPWIIAGVAGVGLFIAFAIWGGIPADVSAAAFWAQSAIFLLVICAFVIALWRLLIRPLAPGLRQPQKQALTFRARELLALILALGGFATVVGGLWDEVWHRSYGIPFGEDLLWRPHLLIYFGFATASVCGFWALLYLNRHLRGNFQQRFRANTMVGLLIMNAAFLLYALPADPVWHLIFGEDITPWSVPHLILLISFVVTQLLALDLHVSTWKRHEWHVIFKLRLDDSLSLLILAAMQMLWLQLMLIDWDAAIVGVAFGPLDLYRPEWLLAANPDRMRCLCGRGSHARHPLRRRGHRGRAAGLGHSPDPDPSLRRRDAASRGLASRIAAADRHRHLGLLQQRHPQAGAELARNRHRRYRRHGPECAADAQLVPTAKYGRPGLRRRDYRNCRGHELVRQSAGRRHAAPA